MERSMEDLVVYTYLPGALTQIRFPDGRVLTGDELQAYMAGTPERLEKKLGENGGDSSSGQA